MNVCPSTSHHSQSENYSEHVSFQLKSSDRDDFTMPEMKISEENKTILFEDNAKMYRYVETTKDWIICGTGKIQIANMDDSNTVQLILYCEEKSNFFCQLIDKDTKFNEKQTTEAVLTWFGQNLLEKSKQTRQWAVKFEDTDTCKMFRNIILVATSVPEQEQTNDFQSTGFMNQLLEFSALESLEKFKQRCESARLATKAQRFWSNLQTWREINESLRISTESQKRYYERKLGHGMS